MKPFHFTLPASFDPREFLKTQRLQNRMDDARYFVSLILRKLAHRDVDELGVVRLHARFLGNVMSIRTCAAVVEALLEGDAVERFPYTPGLRSFGYRLSRRFVADRHVRIEATDARLIARLKLLHGLQEAESTKRMLPVHRALARQQRRLRIHAGTARDILKSLPPKSNEFDCQGILVGDIERREFRLNVGHYGRVANSITSLKRELRQTLHVDGQPLGHVDLSCAQPAFVARIMQHDGTDSREGTDRQTGRGTKQSKYDLRADDAADYADYRKLVCAGSLYDTLLRELHGHDISRDDVKRRFLADVIAKKGSYPSVVEGVFRQLFPSVHEWIRGVNRDDHATLIRLLQREESKLVIEDVAADLLTRHPWLFVLTLHDALFAQKQHLPVVEDAFHRAFARTGFSLTLKSAG